MKALKIKLGDEWDDVLQEAFLKTIKKKMTTEHFKRYLFMTIRNTALDKIKVQRQRQESLYQHYSDNSVKQDIFADGIEVIVDVRNFFKHHSYSNSQILALYMHFLGGISQAGLSKMFGGTQQKWGVFLYGTKALMKEELSDYGYLSPRKETEPEQGTITALSRAV